MTAHRSFNLTNQHIALLRRANVTWGNAEYGAPRIDPKRPYGNSDVEGDMLEILQNEVKQQLGTLHRETETALCIILKTGSFIPGVYITSCEWTDDWMLVKE